MPLAHRVLNPMTVPSLDGYLIRNGGVGLETARKVEPEALIDEIEAAGLRGRGGGGFPTHLKWRAVVENRSDESPTTVVVNGAEGEPGTFKDRTILHNNPYQVIEGAIIAAMAVGANRIIFALKASFGDALERVRDAIDEVTAAGWVPGIELMVFEGPNEYLYGEETAMLETIEGRFPLPRLAPPYRRGLADMGPGHARDLDRTSGLSARVEMAAASNDTHAPPALVNNVETLANVPRIIARGGRWFRTEGTVESPGTIVCTITGATQRSGVGEVMMGTTLREAIELIGGGMPPGRSVKAVMSGVANAIIPASALDTPLSYEGMQSIGSGLGSAGFTVYDDTDDMVSVAAGVSRFLAIESCGQCTPCKEDGLTLSDLLDKLCHDDANAADLATIEKRLITITTGARCYLATQHQVTVSSVFEQFPDEVRAHADRSGGATQPLLVAELEDIDRGEALVDLRHRDKNPDWTYNSTESGQAPADRLSDHRREQSLE